MQHHSFALELYIEDENLKYETRDDNDDKSK